MSRPPEKYLAIKAWGVVMGNTSSYVEEQQQLASEQDAPLDATFRDEACEGGWSTLREITNQDNMKTCKNLISSWINTESNNEERYRSALIRLSSLMYSKTVMLGQEAPAELKEAMRLLGIETYEEVKEP